MRRAYTSTVTGSAHLTVGLAIAVAFGVATVTAGVPVWVTAVGATAIALTAVHVSTVRLSIGADRVVVGHGPWHVGAWAIPTDTISGATAENLRWPQVFGVGVHFHRNVERLTVRPGPTLHLRLSSGEHLRVSTPDPATARRLMPAVTTSIEEDESVGDNQHHPWFGPKRIGYGLRPRSWQGWAIVLALCAIVVVIALLVR